MSGNSKRQKLVARDISEGFGKLPPSALDMEESVLGAVLLEKNALVEVVDLLRPEDFYSESNGIIWETIVALFNEGSPVDMRSVVARLRKDGKLEIVDGAYRVAELTSKVSSGANIDYHSRIIIEMSIKRSLIHTASQVHHSCYEDTSDVFELLDSVQSKFDKIATSYFKNNSIDAPTLYKKTIDKIVKDRNDVGLTGIPTGYTELDKITGGWQQPNLIIIAARPSMGKTSVVICCAMNAALDYQKPVAIFSLESSALELMNRMISAQAEVDLDRIIRGSTNDFELQQIGNRSTKLKNAPIYIDDTASLSILELRAKARRLKHEHNIQLIIVDYLQLMRGDSNTGNREQEIASISRALKGIAKELEVPVIALSQLSRGVESRGGAKRPMLSDLRESGQIEQDADTVLFLYRPEYYGITVDENGMSTHGLLEIIAAKNRNGKVGSVNLKFIARFTKIMNLYGEAPEGFVKVAPKRIEEPRIIVRDPTESNQDDDIPF